MANGSSVFAENCDKEVPCDVAAKNSHSDVALFLESKMVFSVSCLCYSPSLRRAVTLVLAC